MNAENQIIGNQPEQVSYANLQVLVTAGKHTVESERDYAESRRRLGDLGVGFFKRGFTNIMFLEDAFGSMAPRIENLNNDVQKFGSFRTAYWSAIRDYNDADAKRLTQIFEQTPMLHTTRIGKEDGLSASQIGNWGFIYGVFGALDNISRKGYSLRVTSEIPTDARHQFNAIEARTVEDWRELAQYKHDIDKALAAQIEELAEQNPNKMRLMAIVGSGHAALSKSLPQVLQYLTEVRMLSLEDPRTRASTIFDDIREGSLSDEEIEHRISDLRMQLNNYLKTK